MHEAVDMVGVVVMAANKEDTVASKADMAVNREDTVANQEDMEANKVGMEVSKEHIAVVTVAAALTIAGGMAVVNTQRRHMKAGQLLKSVVCSQAQRFIVISQN